MPKRAGRQRVINVAAIEGNMETRWYPGWKPKLKQMIAEAKERKAESVPAPEPARFVEFDADVPAFERENNLVETPYGMKGNFRGAPKKTEGKFRL